MRGRPALAWEPDKGTHIGVIRRDNPGEVRWFSLPARFVWHVLNGWDEDSRITLDLCEQEAPAFPSVDGSMASDESVWGQRLARWEFDWESSSEIAIQIMSDVTCEYPRSDERFAMKRTRHGYFACHGGPGTGDLFHRGIAHFDYDKHQMSTFLFGETSAVSEPVFLPGAVGAAEGDGHLVCLVYDEERDQSQIVLLNAQRVEDGPIATAGLEYRVPMGFHGLWIGASRQ